MTREEILRDYMIDSHGRITDSGTFSGEMLYAPYFLDKMIDGLGEEVYDTDGDEDGEADGTLLYTRLDVQPEDREEFPELDPATTEVLVYESDQGFVHVEEI